MLGEKFLLIQQEAFLARSSLLSGLDALRKANVSDTDKGKFYEAFFLLSIGLERLMKLMVVCHHMAKNQLNPPSNGVLKAAGHNLLGLYETCRNVAISEMPRPPAFVSEGELEFEVLKFLSEFAKYSRYYNLDTISAKSVEPDPLAEWWKILGREIMGSVSARKRQQIESESIQYCDSIGAAGFTYMRGMDGQLMTTLEAVAYPRFAAAAAPYSVWRVIRIAAPIYSLSWHITDIAHQYEVSIGRNHPAVPYLYEFFPFLGLDRRTVLSRKAWK